MKKLIIALVILLMVSCTSTKVINPQYEDDYLKETGSYLIKDRIGNDFTFEGIKGTYTIPIGNDVDTFQIGRKMYLRMITLKDK